MLRRPTSYSAAPILILVGLFAAGRGDAADSFSTNGHTVFHLRMATIQPGQQRVLVAAAYDGTVLCLTRAGDLIWRNQITQGLPTDLDVRDLDGDGRDESLLASADGTLYALDHAGEVRWKVHREPPLIQVCAVCGEDRVPTIVTGGVERRLFALSPDGTVVKELDVKYPVRHIRSGDFLGDGREVAAVITAKNDRSRFFLQLYKPETLEPIWEKPFGLSTKNATVGTKYFVPWMAYRVAAASLLTWDINGDGRDEMLITDYFDKKGELHAFDTTGTKILSSPPDRRIPNRPYRMNLLTGIDASNRGNRRILGLYGNQLIVYQPDGAIEHIVDGSFSPACAEFDSESNTLFLGSSISGGDGIYALKLDQPDWRSDYEDLKPVGRLAEVEKNMAKLAAQVERFTRPSYPFV